MYPINQVPFFPMTSCLQFPSHIVIIHHNYNTYFLYDLANMTLAPYLIPTSILNYHNDLCLFSSHPLEKEAKAFDYSKGYLLKSSDNKLKII